MTDGDDGGTGASPVPREAGSAEVLTLGETMVAFVPEEPGPLTYVPGFRRRLGGAESNLAVALARLDHDVVWLSRLGDDPFGQYIHNFVRGEGVRTAVTVTDDAPTGIMFKERREAGESRVFYYRHGSAAAGMDVSLLPAFEDEGQPRYEWLHLTGITPALSDACRELVRTAAERAAAAGVKVSLDPNLRHRLWSPAAMRATLVPLCEYATVVMPGLEEGATLFDAETPDAVADAVLDAGAETAVVKLGAEGALVATADDRERVAGFEIDRVIDPVGAGDGFAAGYLSGRLEGLSRRAAVRRANAVGAFATTVTGDVEGFPTRSELDRFLAGEDRLTR